MIDDISKGAVNAKAGQIKGRMVLLDLSALRDEGFWKFLAGLRTSAQLLKDAGTQAILMEPHNEKKNLGGHSFGG